MPHYVDIFFGEYHRFKIFGLKSDTESIPFVKEAMKDERIRSIIGCPSLADEIESPDLVIYNVGEESCMFPHDYEIDFAERTFAFMFGGNDRFNF